MIDRILFALAIALALTLPLAWLGNAGALASCLDHASRAECETWAQKLLAIRP